MDNCSIEPFYCLLDSRIKRIRRGLEAESYCDATAEGELAQVMLKRLDNDKAAISARPIVTSLAPR